VEAGRENKCSSIIGLYVPTKKNQIVKDFYKNHEFSLLESTGGINKYCWAADVQSMNYPEYFRTIDIPVLVRSA
jgi:predicted enzyme involved in methoxymalonyl-ACP biosynthesis